MTLVLVVVAVVVVPNTARLVVGIHDAASLPDHLTNCGRDYLKDATERRFWTLADIASQPTLVDPGIVAQLMGQCQQSTRLPSGCDTVVFVRVDWDAYVDYALGGGC